MCIKKTVLLFFITLLFFYNVANAFSPFIGKVKTDNVNVRLGANINFITITQLNTNDQVKVVDELYDWYKIELPNKITAYVSTKYVTVLPDNELAQVNADNLNVRINADIDSAILGQLDKGTLIKIKAVKNNFFEIDSQGLIFGWINKMFIEKKPPKTS